MRWRKQSQRKPIQLQEANNKRECNHPEQHQQERREEASKNRTTEESEAFLAFPSCHAFFQGRWQVDKTTKNKTKTNNVISPKATNQKHLFLVFHKTTTKTNSENQI